MESIALATNKTIQWFYNICNVIYMCAINTTLQFTVSLLLLVLVSLLTAMGLREAAPPGTGTGTVGGRVYFGLFGYSWQHTRDSQSGSRCWHGHDNGDEDTKEIREGGREREWGMTGIYPNLLSRELKPQPPPEDHWLVHLVHLHKRNTHTHTHTSTVSSACVGAGYAPHTRHAIPYHTMLMAELKSANSTSAVLW